MLSTVFFNTSSLGNTSSKNWAESVGKVSGLSTTRFASTYAWVQLGSLSAVYARVNHILNTQLLGIISPVENELCTLSTRLIKRTTKYINRSIV